MFMFLRTLRRNQSLSSSTGLVEAETIFNPIFCRLKGRLFRRAGLSSLKIEMHDE